MYKFPMTNAYLNGACKDENHGKAETIHWFKAADFLQLPGSGQPLTVQAPSVIKHPKEMQQA